MALTQIVQARVDREVKAQAAEALAAMGLSISDAVRIVLTRIAREKTFPLELFMLNAETKEAMEDAQAGKTEAVTLDAIRDVFHEKY